MIIWAKYRATTIEQSDGNKERTAPGSPTETTSSAGLGPAVLVTPASAAAFTLTQTNRTRQEFVWADLNDGGVKTACGTNHQKRKHIVGPLPSTPTNRWSNSEKQMAAQRKGLILSDTTLPALNPETSRLEPNKKGCKEK